MGGWFRDPPTTWSSRSIVGAHRTTVRVMTAMGVAFEATVECGRPDQPRYVVVPEAVVTALGIKATATVSGTIAGVNFTRQAIKRPGRTRAWFLDVTAPVARKAKIDTGHVVEVMLRREPEDCPADLAAALAADPAAESWWSGASAQKRRQMVNDVERAKKPETRAARIERWVRLVSDWQRTTGRSSF